VGWLAELAVTLGTEVKPGTVEAVAFFVPTDGGRPRRAGHRSGHAGRVRVAGKVGQWLALPGADQAVQVVVGVGEGGAVSATNLGRPSSRSHRHGHLTGGGDTMSLSTEQLE
jgi:hypothetical protein